MADKLINEADSVVRHAEVKAIGDMGSTTPDKSQ